MEANAPALKDAASALLGGFAGLAGVVLVLIGFLYLQASSFGDADDSVGGKYRNVGKLGLVPFVLCIVVVWSTLLDLLRVPAALSPFSYWASGAALFTLTVYGFATFLVYLK